MNNAQTAEQKYWQALTECQNAYLDLEDYAYSRLNHRTRFDENGREISPSLCFNPEYQRDSGFMRLLRVYEQSCIDVHSAHHLTFGKVV